MSVSAARFIVESLRDDPAALDELRDLLRALEPPAAEVTSTNPDAEWLDTRRAATYLGISANALHKHTSARTIRFEQDVPGGKCWFRREDLDRFRRGERQRALRAA